MIFTEILTATVFPHTQRLGVVFELCRVKILDLYKESFFRNVPFGGALSSKYSLTSLALSKKYFIFRYFD
jgi:hypothetical protein